MLNLSWWFSLRIEPIFALDPVGQKIYSILNKINSNTQTCLLPIPDVHKLQTVVAFYLARKARNFAYLELLIP
jgi:hypothetical protein